ncbi:MAG: hypothetical protein WAW86_10835 [Gammaproteobacteria bacterium]
MANNRLSLFDATNKKPNDIEMGSLTTSTSDQEKADAILHLKS